MKFLVIAKQKKNVDTFEGVIASLLASGHAVTLAVQQRDPERDARLAERLRHPGFALTACPDDRGDAWRSAAPLIRSTRDWAQYTKPAYRHAGKLHRRAVERLFRELGVSLSGEAPPLGEAASVRLQHTLAQVERSIPSDPLHEEFLTRHAPDVVIVTPGLHFGSGQTDVMKAARAVGLPLWMWLFSWDNLSTKGALHVHPDLMFVWNERQRQEAVELHDFPGDRVVVVGAPRFDEFFALTSRVPRDAFFAPLGLDPERPALLYLCSSRFIAARELAFIQSWLAALRASGSALARCNVLVRPHPDVTLVDEGPEPTAVTWPDMRQATGWVQRPFDDDGAIVLRTTYSTQDAFYECLHHARAVIALNTSAELEAGIAGRPVYTVLTTDAAADGQANTLHFNYLLREHGGFVHYAPDLDAHMGQLARGLDAAPEDGAIRAFIMEFLRPLGDRPVAPLLAAALAERAVALHRPADVGLAGVPHPLQPVSRAGEMNMELTSEGDARPVAPSVTPSITPSITTPGATSGATLRLGGPDSRAALHSTASTQRGARHGAIVLPPALEAWLAAEVRPGDVLYDIGAGAGACSILAALQRGAAAIAFEPGFAVFKELCDNVILNGCGRTVVPLPVALGDRAGLRELDYPHTPGSDHHALRGRDWRIAREGLDGHYVQPVAVERLDDVVRRHRLPPPNVVRLSVRSGADAVLAGAADVLQAHRPRSILVILKDPVQERPLRLAAERVGYLANAPGESGAAGLALRLTPGPDARRARPWAAVRRAARRLRSRG